MSTDPTTSQQEVLSAFRRFAHDLWEATMSAPIDKDLPQLRDYRLPGNR